MFTFDIPPLITVTIVAASHSHESFSCLRQTCTSCVWSPQSVGLIRKIESVQRQFTKRFPCCRHLAYNDRLVKLNIDSLELRRLRLDLVYVYKIMFGLVDTDKSDYFTLQSANDYSAATRRGNPYKLLVNHCRRPINVRKKFFSERVY